MYEPLVIIPLMVGSYILFGGIAGGLFFQEFDTLHEQPVGYWAWALYIGGMLMVLVGLAMIADAPDRSGAGGATPRSPARVEPSAPRAAATKKDEASSGLK